MTNLSRRDALPPRRPSVCAMTEVGGQAIEAEAGSREEGQQEVQDGVLGWGAGQRGIVVQGAVGVGVGVRIAGCGWG